MRRYGNLRSRPWFGMLVATVLAWPLAAIAGEGSGSGSHSGHDQGAAKSDAASAEPQPELSEASKAYDAAMHKMHKDMALPYTNDVDIDFVRGMVPHHQGAIEQAEILLKYSKNPRLRRLAGGIIASQKREIRFMLKWLEENAKGVETSEMPEWLKNNPSTVEDAQRAGGKE